MSNKPNTTVVSTTDLADLSIEQLESIFDPSSIPLLESNSLPPVSEWMLGDFNTDVSTPLFYSLEEES